MAKKITNEDIRGQIDSQGFDYWLEHYYDVGTLEDKELDKIFEKAQEAIIAANEAMEERDML